MTDPGISLKTNKQTKKQTFSLKIGVFSYYRIITKVTFTFLRKSRWKTQTKQHAPPPPKKLLLHRIAEARTACSFSAKRIPPVGLFHRSDHTDRSESTFPDILTHVSLASGSFGRQVLLSGNYFCNDKWIRNTGDSLIHQEGELSLQICFLSLSLTCWETLNKPANLSPQCIFHL